MVDDGTIEPELRSTAGRTRRARSGLQQQAEPDDADEPDQADRDRQPVEVLLHHGRPTQRGGDAATEQVGQTAALTAVQQDQQDEQQAGQTITSRTERQSSDEHPLLGEVAGHLVAGLELQQRWLYSLADLLSLPAPGVEAAGRTAGSAGSARRPAARSAPACPPYPGPVPVRPTAVRACTGAADARTARPGQRSRRSCRGT